MRYFEDLDVGEPTELGSRTVTEAAIIEFATQYDPIPFHVDRTAAAASGHEGLIASGFHTLCLVNAIVVEEFRRETAGVAGLGLDDLRWPTPVTPGDEITVIHRIEETRVSTSQPDRGIVVEAITGVNQADDVVVTYRAPGLFERRSAAT